MKPKIFLIVLICAPLFISNCKKDSADQDKPHLLFNSGITYGAMADNDGNTYKTIQIGTQLLMAENLKTTKYSDGTAILNVTDNTQWSTLNTAAYCWYNNDSNYKAVYGALYNFYAVSDIIRNLCPKGWIVPGDDDWSNLTTFLGTEEFAGGKMKETGTTHWLTPNTGATNESGFTGLPGGERRNDGPFADMGSTGYWWCSTMHAGWLKTSGQRGTVMALPSPI
ncbi:MAG: fibrobacter succinogenes major paralogous domain-containing protein [Bacteroidia bacterium]|nr:fibrobacter succinogenes major paralogous domain-containing protein [Bacteroidia bacterium]